MIREWSRISKPSFLATEPCRSSMPAVHELFDPAAVQTDNMIVMSAMVDFENRHSVFEVVPGHQARRLELGEHPVHRGEADVLVGLQQ